MTNYNATCVIYFDRLLDNGFLSAEPKAYIQEYEVDARNVEDAFVKAFYQGKQIASGLLGTILNPRLASVSIDDLV